MFALSFRASAILAGGLLLVGSDRAVGLMIDDFSYAPFEATSYGGFSLGFDQGPLNGPGAPLGGSRQGFVRGLASPDDPVPGAWAGIAPLSGQFHFGTSADSHGYLNLTWAANPDSNSPTFDLVQQNNDRLRLRFSGSENITGMGIKIGSVVDGETHVARSRFGSGSQALPPDAIVELPFSGFSGVSDFSAVTSITLETARFRPNSGLLLDSISAEPTPIAGDLDRDNDVDRDDFDYWVDSYIALIEAGVHQKVYTNDPGQWLLSADANLDGYINAAEYTVWRHDYLNYPPRAGVVPEPTALLTGGVGIAASLVLNRRPRGRR